MVLPNIDREKGGHYSESDDSGGFASLVFRDTLAR